MKKRASRSVVAKSAKLKTLLRQRANILGSAALIKKFNDQYQQGQFHQVKVRIDTLDRLWADFAHIQDEIEEIEDVVTGDEIDDEEEPTISAQRVQFQSMYHELKASLVSKLPLDPPPSGSVVNRPPVQPMQSVRLPEIHIPDFCGNPSKWIAFRDIFRSMIHSSVHLSSVQKMHYEWENSCQENVRPTYEQLTEFVRKTSRVLQSVKLLQTPNHPVEPKPSKPKSISIHVATEVTNKCPPCKDAHPLFKCDQFVGMEVKQRFEMVKKNGLCINCLKGPHLAKNCSSGSCRNCSKKHHTLLHLPPLAVAAKPSSSQTTLACSTAASEVIPPAQPQVSSNSSVVASHSFSSPPSRSQQPPVGSMSSGPVNSFSVPVRAPCGEVFLSTVAVKVKDSNGNPRYVRGVLDSCSQANFISEALARKLELKRDRISIDVSGIGQGIVHIRSKVLIRISSRFGGLDYPLECLVIPQITVTLPSKHIDISDWNLPNNVPLADPRFNISSGVDILVGRELFYSLMLSHTINLRAGFPILQKTVFGYVVAGRLSTASRTSPIRVVSATTSLDNKLQRFWEVENFDGYKAMTPLEEACEGHFRSTVSRTSDGRYMVRLPVRDEMIQLLGDSFAVAQRRFWAIERKFAANHEFKSEYVKFMEEYAALGHMELSPRVEIPQFVLPHHAIFRLDSSTTKTRVVFDATCKGSSQLSLNDVLLVGPIVQPPLLAIVLNWRIPRFVFKADIEKMFRQFWVHPLDRRFLQVLWRTSTTQPLQRYQLTTVTYGTSCAPHLATRVLNQLAEDEGHRYPLGAKVIRKGFYMDDALSGEDDLEIAVETVIQLTELLKLGGFNLREWSSNDPRILAHLPDELKEFAPETEIDDSGNTKTLGLLWSHVTDEFGFKIPSLPPSIKVSKRVVASEMAQLFDPLGLVGSVVMSAKMFIQKLWAIGIPWDDDLPENLRDWWLRFREEIPQLADLKIPRRVLANDFNSYALHCFCDASDHGYGACVYVVSSNGAGDHYSQLLIAKSRVAPLRGLTAPKLELCAALLGCQLLDQVRSTTRFTGVVTFWSDSSIVLHWIRSPPTVWKVFVSNRIAEIQKLSIHDSWRHVPSKANSADRISRGVLPSEILEDSLWWHGPNFLVQAVETWPEDIVSLTREEQEVRDVEARQVVTFAVTHVDHSIIHRYSDLGRLLRVVSYCFRFCRNALSPQNRRKVGPLQPPEVDYSLKSLIRSVQGTEFPEEIRCLSANPQPRLTSKDRKLQSSFKSLNPFLDNTGLLRIGGRLAKLSASLDTRAPILLPAKHHLSWLIARSLHLRTLHGGPTLLLATMRQRFWPLRGRDLVRKVVQQCVTCFRCAPKPTEQFMAPLPSVRITPARVFANSGMDYCRPFGIRPLVGRGANVKMYVAVFVCMVVKAVHLEVVTDLTSVACINAVKRFIARRGRVVNLYCDNSTAFVGADRELKHLRRQYLQQYSTEQWNGYCLESGITFNFIPPRSPHHGGLWEAGVKSFKHHLRRILGCRSFTLEEFNTTVAQIESMLNSRPLSPLSSHPQDLSSLTPGHFLVGEPLFSIPEPDYTTHPVGRLNRYQEMKRSVQDFWKRWAREYVSELHQRSKWQRVRDEVKVGSLVLLKQEGLPPLEWNLGRVVAVSPGTDGHVRVVEVRTAKGYYTRAVTEVFLLPIEEPLVEIPSADQEDRPTGPSRQEEAKSFVGDL
ncbi:uncharacterized protein LOC115258488 [Aedes albopictus]|uniref:Integrase catalytic domain-containing protein n=1 Tax=Aedes albopictus TaxID=7160 RepID=A0ABM1ZP25_AEDAL